MDSFKSIFRFILILTVGLAFSIALSLRGEREYLENCKTLSIECEQGRVHKTLDRLVGRTLKLSETVFQRLSEYQKNKGKEPSTMDSKVKEKSNENG